MLCTADARLNCYDYHTWELSFEVRAGSEEGSYLRLIDFLSLNSRLESNKEEKKKYRLRDRAGG